MTGSEIRRLFLEYFVARDHLELPSAPLVPQGDPSTLFISAGMQPLQPYFWGIEAPPAPRLVTCQKCFRTTDLEEVGKTDRHGTFFEMLGNFAPTGAYFKETAIPLAWELVTKGFGLPEDRLRVTIFAGNAAAPRDEEAWAIWANQIGIRPDWIYEYDEDNWWGLDLGPCGPDSEIWFDRGEHLTCTEGPCYPGDRHGCRRFYEFWNLVFPQFDKQPDGSLPRLESGGAIDTGMGLERMSVVMQDADSIFETDLFMRVREWIRAGAKASNVVSERVVADALRAASFLIAEGITPSNEGRGYVLRRVLRRGQLHAGRLGLGVPLSEGVAVVAEQFGDHYPELRRRAGFIGGAIAEEAERFHRALEQGTREFDRVGAAGAIAGPDAFKLHDTFGFPIELTLELAEERGISVDLAGFRAALEEQRARSRSKVAERWANLRDLPRSEFRGYTELELESVVARIRRGAEDVEEVAEGDEVEVYLEATPFYAEAGGQIGDTGRLSGPEGVVRVEDTQKPADRVHAHLGVVAAGRLRVGDRVKASVEAQRRHGIARHHTATHLLHKALREVLGPDATQRGSWVGPDHTTFDFVLPRAMSPAELERVGRRINEQIRASLPLKTEVKPYKEAVAAGAMHLFEEKYGDEVRVVCFGDWTCELCGGTHVASSADVGPALILGESSIGAGLRRIDLVAGEPAEAVVAERLRELNELSRGLGVAVEEVPARVGEIRVQLKQAERRIEKLQDELRVAQVSGGAGVRRLDARVPLGVGQVAAEDLNDLTGYADRYLEAIGGHGVVAVTSGENFVIKVSRDLASDGVDATTLTASFGRGGGRPDMARGRLTADPEAAFAKLQEALKA